MRGRKGSGEIREGGSVRTDRRHIMGMERCVDVLSFSIEGKSCEKSRSMLVQVKEANKGAGFVYKVRVGRVGREDRYERERGNI